MSGRTDEEGVSRRTDGMIGDRITIDGKTYTMAQWIAAVERRLEALGQDQRTSDTTVVYGVWDHGWDHDALIGLYWRRSDAEAKLKEEPRSTSVDSPDYSWEIEEHELRGER